MKLRHRALALAGLAAFAGTSARAGTLYISRMSNANEISAVPSNATGIGTVILNDAGTSAIVRATQNIATAGTGPVTAGHIHRGDSRTVGPVIFPFASPTSPVGPLIWAIPAADVVNLQTLNLYMNFHTARNPVGEIRGQLVRALLAPSARNSTQTAVANAMDVSFAYDTDLDLSLIQANLAGANEQAQALDDLSGRSLYVQSREAIEAMRSMTASVLTRVENSRLAEQSDKKGFAGFVDGGVDFGTRKTRNEETGGTLTRPYVMGGIDYGYGNGTKLGFAVGYSEGRNDLSAGAGKTVGKTTSIQGFASTNFGHSRFAADGTLGFGWNSYAISRNILSFGRTSSAAPDGSVFSGAIKLSVPYGLGADIQAAPYAQFDYQQAEIDGYTEADSGALGLMVPGQKISNSNVELGWRMIASYDQSWGTLRPSGQIGWRHALNDGSTSLATRLIGSPVTFATRFLGLKDSAHLGALISAQMKTGVEASIGYRGYVGGGGSDSHGLEFRIRAPF